MIRLTVQGCEYIESWEGCELYEYPDSGGLPTIYIGHLIKFGETFNHTREEAEAVFEKDIDNTEKAVMSMLKVEVNDNQYLALVDMAYNAGVGALQHSHTLALINGGADKSSVGDIIERAFVTVHKDGKVIVVSGLVARRKADANLWMS